MRADTPAGRLIGALSREPRPIKRSDHGINRESRLGRIIGALSREREPVVRSVPKLASKPADFIQIRAQIISIESRIHISLDLITSLLNNPSTLGNLLNESSVHGIDAFPYGVTKLQISAATTQAARALVEASHDVNEVQELVLAFHDENLLHALAYDLTDAARYASLAALDYVEVLRDFYGERQKQLPSAALNAVVDNVDGAIIRLRSATSVRVDVSGEDLTGIEIDNVHQLAGVIWSDTTRWPEYLLEIVKSASNELSPGVYVIGDGYARDPSTLTLV